MATEPPESTTDLFRSLSLGATQNEFDFEFFQRIVFRNPYHLDALRQLVEALVHRGDYGAALELDRRLVQIRPADTIARYNLACTLSLLGHVDEALAALDEAIGLGYGDVAHMEADGDLEAVRNHPRYPEVLCRHGIA